MIEYKIDTSSLNRTDVTLSCAIGVFYFKDGEITTNEELAKYFPKLFKSITPIEPLKPIEYSIPETIKVLNEDGKEIELNLIPVPINNSEVGIEETYLNEPENISNLIIEDVVDEPKKRGRKPKN